LLPEKLKPCVIGVNEYNALIVKVGRIIAGIENRYAISVH
jgi:hypothetical protein